jgi:hypothetical protein
VSLGRLMIIANRPRLVLAAVVVAALLVFAVRAVRLSEARPRSWWIVPERWALDCTPTTSGKPKADTAEAHRECEVRENLRALAVEHQRCTAAKECFVLRKIRTLDCGVPLSKRHLGDFLSKYRELHDRLSEDPSSRCRPMYRAACVDGWCVASDEKAAQPGVAPAGAPPRR